MYEDCRFGRDEKMSMITYLWILGGEMWRVEDNGRMVNDELFSFSIFDCHPHHFH